MRQWRLTQNITGKVGILPAPTLDTNVAGQRWKQCHRTHGLACIMMPLQTKTGYKQCRAVASICNRKIMYFAPRPSGDFDNDGRLDIFLPSWWPQFPSMLLKNETPAGGYLDVTVVGSKGVNRMGIGAMVRAYKAGRAGKSDAMLASEEISTGYGFCSGQPAASSYTSTEKPALASSE